MPYITVRGVEHYYEWIKQPSTEAKPVMVFVHGWAGSCRYWQSTARALSDKFDCLVYDMRGFGRSKGKPTAVEASVAVAESGSPQAEAQAFTELSYELEDYAHELAALLDGLEINKIYHKIYLNAHSMGASIGTLFLNRYSQRVEKAILTCSGVFEYDEKAFAAFYQFGGYVVKFRPKWLAKIPFVDRIFMARFLRSPIPAAERQAFLEDFLLADYETALGTIFTSVSKYQAEVMPQEFAELDVPTLLVAGEYDQIIPAELGRRAATFSDKVKLVVMKDTAHFPMLEDAETYLKVVREFVNC